jgi:hypothetical protein
VALLFEHVLESISRTVHVFVLEYSSIELN